MHYDIDSVMQILHAFGDLKKRAEWIASLKLGDHNYTVEFEDISPTATFQVSWDEYCGRGCCPADTYCENIPLRYLWMSDADVQVDIDILKAIETAAKFEIEQQKKIKEAEAVVDRARRKLAAANNAVANLADAEKALAALKEASCGQ